MSVCICRRSINNRKWCTSATLRLSTSLASAAFFSSGVSNRQIAFTTAIAYSCKRCQPALPSCCWYETWFQASWGSFFRPLTCPKSQSVMLTTLLVRSQCLSSSACSMVWVRIRPSSSNSKMKRPQKSWSCLPEDDCLCVPGLPGLSPLSLRLILEIVSLRPLPSVFHRTIRLSLLIDVLRFDCGENDAFWTIRSLRMASFTFPTIGMVPQATGEVHRAA